MSRYDDLIRERYGPLERLEDERMRPVPPAPPRLPSPLPDPQRAAEREQDRALKALRAAGEAYRTSTEFRTPVRKQSDSPDGERI